MPTTAGETVSALAVEVLKATALRAVISPAAAWEAVVRLGVTPADFPANEVRAVFESLRLRLEAGLPVSPSMLRAGLRTRDVKALALCDEVTVPGSVAEIALEELAQRLKAETRRAAVDDVLTLALQRLRSGGSVDDVLADVASKGESLPGAWKPLESLQEVLTRQVEPIINNDESAWVATGFKPLDRLIGGVPASLVAVGADGGIGKSGWALRWAANLSSDGLNTGFWALEDGAAKMSLRLVSLLSGVALGKIQFRPNNEQRRKAHDAAAVLWGERMARHLYFREMADPLASWVLGDIEAAIRRYSLKLAVIDNTNEVNLSEGTEERHDQRIDSFLKRARRIAERNACIILVVTHLSRRDDDSVTTPIRKRHFAHSMGLTRIPRVTFGLRQPRPGVMAIDIVKANELPLGTVEVVHEGFAALPSNEEAEPAPAPTARAPKVATEEKPKKPKQRTMKLATEEKPDADEP